MSGYGEPEWVNPNVNTPSASGAGVGGGGGVVSPQNNSSSSGSNSKLILIGLSVLNVALSALMAALGVLTIINVHREGIADLSEPFLASYMVMFALLLFIYECMWWQAVPFINKSLRKNFGFLYGLRGKGLYLIFVAFLCLGLGKDARVRILNWTTGIAYLAVGVLHIFLVCTNTNLAQEYTVPAAGFTTTTTENDTNLSQNVV